MAPGPVAVTGASGRLGRAVIDAFGRRGRRVVAWSRPEYDVDATRAPHGLIERDSPSLVVHCAAWTDVDGCAREPDLALRRNGAATGDLAGACARVGVPFVYVSTNEVFDGRRTDGIGYREGDPTDPINAYGRSKLAGEEATRRAYDAARALHWIVRTSWLYGPPGDDFPAKIVAAADRLPPDAPLRVVADEWGSPTFAPDLAEAIADLVERADGGTYHLVNAGHASRAEWAARVLAPQRPAVEVVPISQREFARASTPPLWGVLDASKAAAAGVRLRRWESALEDQLAALNAPR